MPGGGTAEGTVTPKVTLGLRGPLVKFNPTTKHPNPLTISGSPAANFDPRTLTRVLSFGYAIASFFVIIQQKDGKWTITPLSEQVFNAWIAQQTNTATVTNIGNVGNMIQAGGLSTLASTATAYFASAAASTPVLIISAGVGAFATISGALASTWATEQVAEAQATQWVITSIGTIISTYLGLQLSQHFPVLAGVTLNEAIMFILQRSTELPAVVETAGTYTLFSIQIGLTMASIICHDIVIAIRNGFFSTTTIKKSDILAGIIHDEEYQVYSTVYAAIKAWKDSGGQQSQRFSDVDFKGSVKKDFTKIMRQCNEELHPALKPYHRYDFSDGSKFPSLLGLFALCLRKLQFQADRTEICTRCEEQVLDPAYVKNRQNNKVHLVCVIKGIPRLDTTDQKIEYIRSTFKQNVVGTNAQLGEVFEKAIPQQSNKLWVVAQYCFPLAAIVGSSSLWWQGAQTADSEETAMANVISGITNTSSWVYSGAATAVTAISEQASLFVLRGQMDAVQQAFDPLFENGNPVRFNFVEWAENHTQTEQTKQEFKQLLFSVYKKATALKIEDQLQLTFELEELKTLFQQKKETKWLGDLIDADLSANEFHPEVKTLDFWKDFGHQHPETPLVYQQFAFTLDNSTFDQIEEAFTNTPSVDTQVKLNEVEWMKAIRAEQKNTSQLQKVIDDLEQDMPSLDDDIKSLKGERDEKWQKYKTKFEEMQQIDLSQETSVAVNDPSQETSVAVKINIPTTRDELNEVASPITQDISTQTKTFAKLYEPIRRVQRPEVMEYGEDYYIDKIVRNFPVNQTINIESLFPGYDYGPNIDAAFREIKQLREEYLKKYYKLEDQGERQYDYTNFGWVDEKTSPEIEQWNERPQFSSELIFSTSINEEPQETKTEMQEKRNVMYAKYKEFSDGMQDVDRWLKSTEQYKVDTQELQTLFDEYDTAMKEYESAMRTLTVKKALLDERLRELRLALVCFPVIKTDSERNYMINQLQHTKAAVLESAQLLAQVKHSRLRLVQPISNATLQQVVNHEREIQERELELAVAIDNFSTAVRNCLGQRPENKVVNKSVSFRDFPQDIFDVPLQEEGEIQAATSFFTNVDWAHSEYNTFGWSLLPNDGSSIVTAIRNLRQTSPESGDGTEREEDYFGGPASQPEGSVGIGYSPNLSPEETQGGGTADTFPDEEFEETTEASVYFDFEHHILTIKSTIANKIFKALDPLDQLEFLQNNDNVALLAIALPTGSTYTTANPNSLSAITKRIEEIAIQKSDEERERQKQLYKWDEASRSFRLYSSALFGSYVYSEVSAAENFDKQMETLPPIPPNCVELNTNHMLLAERLRNIQPFSAPNIEHDTNRDIHRVIEEYIDTALLTDTPANIHVATEQKQMLTAIFKEWDNKCEEAIRNETYESLKRDLWHAARKKYSEFYKEFMNVVERNGNQLTDYVKQHTMVKQVQQANKTIADFWDSMPEAEQSIDSLDKETIKLTRLKKILEVLPARKFTREAYQQHEEGRKNIAKLQSQRGNIRKALSRLFKQLHELKEDEDLERGVRNSLREQANDLIGQLNRHNRKIKSEERAELERRYPYIQKSSFISSAFGDNPTQPPLNVNAVFAMGPTIAAGVATVMTAATAANELYKLHLTGGGE